MATKDLIEAYERHLEEHWTRDGERIEKPQMPSAVFEDARAYILDINGQMTEIQKMPSIILSESRTDTHCLMAEDVQ